jgi:hypothetical protein
LSQEHQLPQRKRDKQKKEALYKEKLRQIKQFHAPDLPQQMWEQNIQKKNSKALQKKTSHCDTYAMCHARRLLDKPQIESPDRASDTVPSDKRTSASNDTKLPFC